MYTVSPGWSIYKFWRNNFLNDFKCTGRLTKAPEVASSGAGKTYARFSLAVQNGWGENAKTDFFDCVAFERVAETIGKQCDKGSRVLCWGSIHIDTYQTKDGKQGRATRFYVNGFEHCDSKTQAAAPAKKNESFMNIPAGVDDEGLPFA